MDPVGPGGEFILDYSVYDALSAGFGRVVGIIQTDADEFSSAGNTRAKPGSVWHQGQGRGINPAQHCDACV
jgi:hypothetical protein